MVIINRGTHRSEGDLAAELELTRRSDDRGDLPRGRYQTRRAEHRRRRQTEVHMVGDVESLEPQLQAAAAAERHVPEEGHIQRAIPRTADRVASEVTDRSRRGQRE